MRGSEVIAYVFEMKLLVMYAEMRKDRYPAHSTPCYECCSQGNEFYTIRILVQGLCTKRGDVPEDNATRVVKCSITVDEVQSGSRMVISGLGPQYYMVYDLTEGLRMCRTSTSGISFCYPGIIIVSGSVLPNICSTAKII